MQTTGPPGATLSPTPSAAPVPPGLKTRLDYDDYAIIPADGRRWELLDGEPHVTPAPSPLHRQVVVGILVALLQHFPRPDR